MLRQNKIAGKDRTIVINKTGCPLGSLFCIDLFVVNTYYFIAVTSSNSS